MSSQHAGERKGEGFPISAEGITVGYRNCRVIREMSLGICAGEVTALVGPNGSGKSTLLKALARLLGVEEGVVYLDGKAIASMAGVEVARRLAVMPQGPVAPAGLTVGELVEQGRFPHVGALRMLRRQDHRAIREALALTDMTQFEHRPLDRLSGGERQRAWLALALTQETPILLLDEPTTFLDVGHQLEVLELIARLNREREMTIVMVLHDLNQAARYSQRMVVLNEGAVVADGLPNEVMTPALMADVFRVRASVVRDPATGCPVCLPHAPLSEQDDDSARAC